MNILVVSTLEVAPVHRDFIVGRREEGSLGSGPGWKLDCTGLSFHWAELAHWPGSSIIYVYPHEEYSLFVQPFIVVMEQYGCASMGEKPRAGTPTCRE